MAPATLYTNQFCCFLLLATKPARIRDKAIPITAVIDMWLMSAKCHHRHCGTLCQKSLTNGNMADCPQFICPVGRDREEA